MLPIYICDDNKNLLSQIIKTVETYLHFNYEHTETSVLAFSDPYKFLKHIENSNKTGIYLLDIDFKQDITGLDLATEIRLNDPLGFIIFVTTYDKYIPETYSRRLGAIDYIIKDKGYLKDQICSALTSSFDRYQMILNKTDEAPKTLLLQANRTSFAIEQNHIKWIEAVYKKHGITIYHGNSATRLPCSLAEIYAKLDKHCFIQCNRSQIVNISVIERIDNVKKELTLKSGKVMQVSRRTLPQLLDMIKK